MNNGATFPKTNYQEYIIMDTKYCEPWMNSACLGYVISAMENLNYTPGEIAEMVFELKELFDWFTVEDADELYTESQY
jgi:hypothetical protein